MTEIQTLEVQFPHELVQYWGWFLAFGAGLVVLGVAAVVRSVTATVATMLFFGWLLVIASGIEIAQAVMVGHWAGFFYHLLAAILFGVTGLLLVMRPLISAEVVTAVMAIFFIIGGLFQLIGSLAIALPGWGWQAADGNHHLCPGLTRSGAMAGLRTMGYRPFRGDRFDLLRPRVDYAGTRTACELKRANEIRT